MRMHRFSQADPPSMGDFPHIVVLDTPARCACRLPDVTTDGQSTVCGCGHTWTVSRLPGPGEMSVWSMQEKPTAVVPCRVASPAGNCPVPAAYWVRDQEKGTRLPACARHAHAIREASRPAHVLAVPMPGEDILGEAVHVTASNDGRVPQPQWSLFATGLEALCVAWAQKVTGRWYSAVTSPWQSVCVAFVPRDGARPALRDLLADLAREHGFPDVTWSESTVEALMSEAQRHPAEADDAPAAANDGLDDGTQDAPEDAVPGCD